MYFTKKSFSKFFWWVNYKIVLFHLSFNIFDCPLNLILIFSLRILFKYLFPNFTSSLKVDVTRQDEKRYFKVKDLVSIKTLSKIYLIYHFMEVISCYVTNLIYNKGRKFVRIIFNHWKEISIVVVFYKSTAQIYNNCLIILFW